MKLNTTLVFLLTTVIISVTFTPGQTGVNVLSSAIKAIQADLKNCVPGSSVTYTSKVKHGMSLFETEKSMSFIKLNGATLEMKSTITVTARMPLGRGNRTKRTGYGKYVNTTIKTTVFDFSKMTWCEHGKSYINKIRVPFNPDKGVLSLKKIREFFPATLMKKRGIQYIKTPLSKFKASFYADDNYSAWKNETIPINKTVKYIEGGTIFLIKSFTGER